MPLLTVRLTDEEHAALKALAAETSMADLIRGWINGGMLPAAAPPRTTQNQSFGAPRPAPKPVKRSKTAPDRRA